MYLARGNHQSKSMDKIYGFEGEVKSKLNDTFFELFVEVFCCLPLGHVINNKVFVVHGYSFSVDGVKLSDIRASDRFHEPPEEASDWERSKQTGCRSFLWRRHDKELFTRQQSRVCLSELVV